MITSRDLWGARTVAAGSGLLIRLGPLRLWVARVGREWLVASTSEGDPQGPEVALEAAPEPPTGLLDQVTRFIADGDDGELVLTPALADRAVVVRPERPLFVQPGEAAVLYLSTPLWVRLSVSNGQREPRLMREIPASRPSDTWFGPSTRHGEVAYASTTAAKTVLASGPVRPARAVTRVVLVNQSGQTLPVERLALPARHLDLVLASNGQIWTDAVRVVVSPDRTADVTIEPTAPDEAGATVPVGHARDPQPRLTVVRALSALLGS